MGKGRRLRPFPTQRWRGPICAIGMGRVAPVCRSSSRMGGFAEINDRFAFQHLNTNHLTPQPGTDFPSMATPVHLSLPGKTHHFHTVAIAPFFGLLAKWSRTATPASRRGGHLQSGMRPKMVVFIAKLVQPALLFRIHFPLVHRSLQCAMHPLYFPLCLWMPIGTVDESNPLPHDPDG